VLASAAGCGDRKDTGARPDRSAAGSSEAAGSTGPARTADASGPTQGVAFRSEFRCEQSVISYGPATDDPNKGEGNVLMTPPAGVAQTIPVPLGQQLMLLDGGRKPIKVLQRLEITPSLTDVMVRYDQNGVCQMFTERP
jgi:hypothetical protein